MSDRVFHLARHLTLTLLVLLTSFCTKDKGTVKVTEPVAAVKCEPTYNNGIKPLVLLKCATTGCHVKNFPFGDFTGYGELKTRINSGKVTVLVFDQKLMPPANAAKLTDVELEKLKCWIDNGAPEN